MKIGSRITVKGKPYTIRSIMANGRIVLQPAAPGLGTDGSIWLIGEECRIVDVATKEGRELAGVVVNIEPIEARVTTPGRWEGRLVGRRNMRKKVK